MLSVTWHSGVVVLYFIAIKQTACLAPYVGGNKMKKFVSALLAAALAASLAACGSTPASEGTDGSSAAGPTAASYTVGI